MLSPTLYPAPLRDGSVTARLPVFDFDDTFTTLDPTARFDFAAPAGALPPVVDGAPLRSFTPQRMRGVGSAAVEHASEVASSSDSPARSKSHALLHSSSHDVSGDARGRAPSPIGVHHLQHAAHRNVGDGAEGGAMAAAYDLWSSSFSSDDAATSAADAAHPPRRATTGLDDLLSRWRRHATRDASAQPDSEPIPCPHDADLPDVVCEDTELKSLLMAPFVREHPVNLLVHRIGPSLLIESASRYEAGAPAAAASTDDSLTTPDARRRQQQGRRERIADRQRTSQRQRAMVSKLLYLSIMAEEGSTDRPVAAAGEPLASALPAADPPAGCTPSSGAASAAQPSALDPFTRRALRWKFDDLSILVGSSTPLVQHGARGTATLRVQDSSAYLRQVETLELWLDNVMNSAGHVAVCYHTDGVVQGYRLVPTDDLPGLGVPPFAPVAVQRHARNVLQWLRASCAEDGGSYVLLKEEGGTELKLFDLRQRHDTFDAASAAAPAPPAPATYADTPAVAGGSPPRRVPPAVSSPLALDDVDNACTKRPHSAEAEAEATAAADCSSAPTSSSGAALATAFDYPVAMMCFRMAQCLPNSDAETLRLLLKAIHLFNDNDTTTALVRATAHAQSAQHYFSCSPLSDSNVWALRHAKLAAQHVATVMTAPAETEFVPAHRDVPPAVSAEALGLSLVKLACGMATNAIGNKSWCDAVEALAVAVGVLSLRADLIPLGLLVQTPDMPLVPHDAEAGGGGKASTAAGRGDKRPSSLAKRQPASTANTTAAAAVEAEAPPPPQQAQRLAALASIEALAADLVAQWLEALGPDEAAAAAVPPPADTSHAARDAYEALRRDIRVVLVAAERAVVDAMLHVARGRAAIAAPGAFVRVPTYEEALEALPPRLATIAVLHGPALEVTCAGLFDAAFASYNRALAAAECDGRGARDVRVKMARLRGLHAATHVAAFVAAERAAKDEAQSPPHFRAQMRTASRASVAAAASEYELAAAAHRAVGDGMSAVRMAHNHSKLLTRMADMAAVDAGGALTARELTLLAAAARVVEAALATDRAVAAGDEGGAACDHAGLHAANVHAIVASRMLATLAAEPPLNLVRERPPPECGAVVLPFTYAAEEHDAAAAAGPRNQQEQQQQQRAVAARVSVDAVVAQAVEDHLLPALRHAKAAKHSPTEAMVHDMLADARRCLAGIAPVVVAGVRPLRTSGWVAAAIASAPVAVRIERTRSAAASLHAAVAAHAAADAQHPAYCVSCLLLCDVYVALAQLLQTDDDAFDQRVEAVERAVAAIHSTRAWLLLRVGSDDNDTARPLPAALAPDAAAILAAQKLAAVLLLCLKLQREAGQHHDGAGSLRALYADAARVPVEHAPGARDGTAVVRRVAALLEQLTSVFRAFDMRGATAAQRRGRRA